MEDTTSLIETLEYVHDLLDSPAQEDRRHNVRVMIEDYRAREKKRTEGYPYQRTVYIPPAL